jgi:hypothetical protein
MRRLSIKPGRRLQKAIEIVILLAIVMILREALAPIPSPAHTEVDGKPPKGAIVLFDGKETSAWQHGPDKPFAWNVADGVMEIKPRTGSLTTKERFRDFQLHVEFNVPSMPDKKGQSKGNSGVYIHGLYEIQILDNTDNPTYMAGGCGSLYRQKDPDKDVSKKPGEWQTYDITFRAPRFDADDKVQEKPRLTLVWNGVKVHDNVEIAGPTSARAKDKPLVKEGTITLQDHGTPVKFRNIWIKPLEGK